MKRLSAVPSNITTRKVGNVSISKPSLSPATSGAKAIQPAKKIKIELSLKSEQPVVEKDDISEPPTKLETNSDQGGRLSPVKITEITEFSSEKTSKVGQTSSGESQRDSSNKDAKSPTKKPQEPKKIPRKKAKKSAPQTATLSENVQWDEDEHDENFVNWTPPVGHSGDGRTKLNEKLGY